MLSQTELNIRLQQSPQGVRRPTCLWQLSVSVCLHQPEICVSAVSLMWKQWKAPCRRLSDSTDMCFVSRQPFCMVFRERSSTAVQRRFCVSERCFLFMNHKTAIDRVRVWNSSKAVTPVGVKITLLGTLDWNHTAERSHSSYCQLLCWDMTKFRKFSHFRPVVLFSLSSISHSLNS